MTTKGQPPRGDAALRQAIATGSPVATNGKQEGEPFPFPINCLESNNSNFVHLEHGITGEQVATFNKGNRATRVRNAEFAMDAWNKAAGWEWVGENGVDWKRVDTAARDEAFASLHAYAKAEELAAAMRVEAMGTKAFAERMDAFMNHLGTMGYRVSQDDYVGFLATYRASALAKAGGK